MELGIDLLVRACAKHDALLAWHRAVLYGGE